MSTLVELRGSREPRERPLARPFNDAVWQAWVAKSRAQDRQSSAALIKAVTWVSIGGLLAAGGLWSHVTPYEVGVRFAVVLGAVVVTFQAFHTRHYAFAAVFGALVLLYNPVAPVFSFSGDWQRALVVTSAVPFVATLAWRNARTEHND